MEENLKKLVLAFITTIDKYTEAKVVLAKVESTPIVRMDDFFKDREVTKAREKVTAAKVELTEALTVLLTGTVAEYNKELNGLFSKHIEDSHSP
jgi:hypothetical protein